MKHVDKVYSAAAFAHEANRSYCLMIGDESQSAWADAPTEVKDSAISGVIHVLKTPDITPQQIHENWVKGKTEQGWKWGPEKDTVAKLHPSLTEFSALPPREQMKDVLFIASVTSALRLLDTGMLELSKL